MPSIFTWKKDPDATLTSKRTNRAHNREERKRKFAEMCKEELEASFYEEIDIGEVTVPVDEQKEEQVHDEEPHSKKMKMVDAMNQTITQPIYSLEQFQNDPSAIHFYSGLESFAKFMLVLHSLGPAASCLTYIYFQVQGVSIENQLFMTLMKLRRYTPNFELSRFFGISEATVKNIVYTWILFMARQWREIDIWPTQNLVRYFAPSDFKAKFPTTRCIIDGTECPIKKPSAPRAQQATFSTYKNRNTVKALIGSTPGGLVNYISPAYGGSTSDRQIVERSNLVSICDPGDSIMADKGFNVQDLFATKNVSINIPSFFKKKNRMHGNIVLNDRKVSSKRVHIERIIGLGKTYKILVNPLTSTETKLSSDILFVCFMLCNFRSCIVSKDA